MARQTLPAVFARGGTSKGLILLEKDLPAAREEWGPLFLRAMGSPDPSGRQLNGMGGGVSSLSKVCVVAPSDRADADVDYTFAQVQIRTASVDFSGNCGNMASAIGPFAVERGLIPAEDGSVTVRIHNTNTSKIIHATFQVRDGQCVEHGDLQIPGVAGAGAPVRLDFIDPGGASTGHLLPTGMATTRLDTTRGSVTVSLIDAGNACVFVRARDVDARGDESPDEIDSRPELLRCLSELRELGSVQMGITHNRQEARARMLVPLVAIISPPLAYRTLAGEDVTEEETDVVVRMISNGQPHRAIPMTGALCVAAAARIPGTIVHDVARATGRPLRIGMPSGVLTLDAAVSVNGEEISVDSGSIYRTTRRLFSGEVSVC